MTDIACAHRHDGFNSICVREPGHDDVHTDGVLSWRNRPVKPAGGPVSDDGMTAHRAPTTKRAAKKTAAPKKES